MIRTGVIMKTLRLLSVLALLAWVSAVFAGPPADIAASIWTP
jgi:hypothetical protein